MGKGKGVLEKATTTPNLSSIEIIFSELQPAFVFAMIALLWRPS